MDGAHAVEQLFSPAIDRDIHVLFLRQIAEFDPAARHVVIGRSGQFSSTRGRCPLVGKLAAASAILPELNTIESFDGLLKAAVGNRLYPTLRWLEQHLVAAVHSWSTPPAVFSLATSGWLIR